MQINSPLFQKSLRPFNKDIVQISGAPITWDFDLSLSQNRDPNSARMLATLVHVYYFCPTKCCDSLFQRLNAKAGIQRIGKLLSQNLAVRPVHNSLQIQKAIFNENLGDITAPNLIGTCAGPLFQQIGLDPELRVFLASVRTFINILQAYDAHQASDIVPPSREPWTEQVITSPLTRAIQTALTIFQDTTPIKVIADHRELLSHSCDVDRSPSTLQMEFPNLYFGCLDETWWHQGLVNKNGVPVEPTEIFQ